MNLDQFQQSLLSLSPLDFEKFVAEVVRRSDRFDNVRLQAMVQDRGIDVEAMEKDPLLGRPRRWVFQVKRAKLVGVDVADYMYAIARSAEQEGPVQAVLVIAGGITKHAQALLARTGIEVWDAAKLAELAPPDLLAEWFGSKPEQPGPDKASSIKSAAFRAALVGTARGRERWSEFQRLVADTLEFLFCPPLELPRYELSDADARNRRDILFENPGSAPFWAQIRADYSAHYIVVDAKNYAKPIPKSAVLDIAHYLKPYGCGMFALLVSRTGSSIAAAHATREQWIGGRKMIIHLSDQDLLEMLDLRATGGAPEEIIRRRIADFRMSL